MTPTSEMTIWSQIDVKNTNKSNSKYIRKKNNGRSAFRSCMTIVVIIVAGEQAYLSEFMPIAV